MVRYVKKPQPTFEAIFQKPGLYPEQVSATLLSRLLSALQRLATGTEQGDENAQRDDQGRIGLLGVRRGSAVYQFTAPLPELTLGHLRETGQILDEPETIGDSEFVLNPLDELSAIARHLGCPITLRLPGRDGAVLARIEGESFARVSKKLVISGDTAVTGTVERVGGTTEQKCALRVPGRSRMLYCRVDSVKVARTLGQMLYEDVVVYGRAHWLKTTWRVVDFLVREVRQPKLGSAAEAFERLRSAGADGWDAIDDPQKHIEEVSGTR